MSFNEFKKHDLIFDGGMKKDIQKYLSNRSIWVSEFEHQG